MSNQGGGAGERDPILLRLELYLKGASIEDGQVTLTRLPLDAPETAERLTVDQLAETACRIYESRRLRARYLNASLLGEPVWDMLLALYCFTSRGERLTVSGLCYASGVPQTTALRWVNVIEERRLISRTRDPIDGRRIYVALTERGEELMRGYLESAHKTLSG